MRIRAPLASVVAVAAVGLLSLLAVQGRRAAPPHEDRSAGGEPVATETPLSQMGRALIARETTIAPAETTPTPPPASGKIRLTVSDRDQYEETANIIEYFKQKPLPKHGPVHSVGDGIDSSDRNAKLPPGTTFARFRYEYEKHDSDRLMADLTWADGELGRIQYEERKAKNTLSREDGVAGELLMRRRQAIVSILAQRAREEELHDRYQNVEVIYQDPKEAKPNGGG